MKRMLGVVGVALLGAGVYVCDPPTLPALDIAPAAATVEAVTSQGMVARLAEADMVLRYSPPQRPGDTAPDPDPGRLFQKKK